MLLLINILIVLFILILSYQIFLAHFYRLDGLEGLENYKEYDTNDPNNVMILAQQNAGNIEVLRRSLDDLTGLKKEVEDISGNVVTLTTQVNDLLQAQQDYISQVTPPEPPEITGAVEEEEEEEVDTSL
jgi:hypothetical protein